MPHNQILISGYKNSSRGNLFLPTVKARKGVGEKKMSKFDVLDSPFFFGASQVIIIPACVCGCVPVSQSPKAPPCCNSWARWS